MDIADALRSRNTRVTRPRRVVWDALAAAGGHLSVQELATEVHRRDPSVNVSSVYRTLTLFAELDLVRESHLGDDVSRWEIAHGDSKIHLVCERCGDVAHHDSTLVESLRSQLVDQAGFAAHSIDVRVSGICGHCTS